LRLSFSQPPAPIGNLLSDLCLPSVGIDVSYETVRRWALKFGAIIARKLPPGWRSPSLSCGWEFSSTQTIPSLCPSTAAAAIRTVGSNVRLSSGPPTTAAYWLVF